MAQDFSSKKKNKKEMNTLTRYVLLNAAHFNACMNTDEYRNEIQLPFPVGNILGSCMGMKTKRSWKP